MNRDGETLTLSQVPVASVAGTKTDPCGLTAPGFFSARACRSGRILEPCWWRKRHEGSLTLVGHLRRRLLYGDIRRPERPRRLLAAALSIGLLAGLLSGASPIGAPVADAAALVPAFSHIYLVVMENREYGAIVGNPRAPYINALIRRYGLATNYYAVTHPSEPNYLALFAGSTFGIRDDAVHDLGARNLADQLASHGRTWHVYAQDYPGHCSGTSASQGGVDLAGAAGWYARKHDPAISFTDISGSATRCAQITRLAGFSPTAASFELIVPNMTNDMHDGSVAQGDSFLAAFVPRITGSAVFATSLLLITWDEGGSNLGGGGRVATIVVSPRVRAGLRSATNHSHYSLLRTIEDAWSLGCLNQACTANNLREFFVH
jgi:phosphatidylinositol-3-phosphatase